MNWFESLLWATYHFQGSPLKLESGSFSTYLKVLNLFQKKLFWMKVFTFSINFGKDCNIPFQVLINFTQVAHTSRWGQNKWCYSYWKFAVILIALFYLKVLLLLNQCDMFYFHRIVTIQFYDKQDMTWYRC